MSALGLRARLYEQGALLYARYFSPSTRRTSWASERPRIQFFLLPGWESRSTDTGALPKPDSTTGHPFPLPSARKSPELSDLAFSPVSYSILIPMRLLQTKFALNLFYHIFKHVQDDLPALCWFSKSRCTTHRSTTRMITMLVSKLASLDASLLPHDAPSLADPISASNTTFRSQGMCVHLCYVTNRKNLFFCSFLDS